MTQTEQDPKKELKSAKQEAFCQARGLEGLNQSDAYREAYNASNMKPDTIINSAYKLMNDGDITARIEYLKETLTDETIKGFAKTKDELLWKLESLIERAERSSQVIQLKDGSFTQGLETDKSLKEIRECLKEQGKLLGYYEDTLKVKGNLGVIAEMREFNRRKETTNQ